MLLVPLSSVIRHIPLGSLDPSMALGFYCRDKGLVKIPSSHVFDGPIIHSCWLFYFHLADDFDDFCSRASKLAEESGGAPLFTVADTHSSSASMTTSHDDLGDEADHRRHGRVDPTEGEDDWQLLWSDQDVEINDLTDHVSYLLVTCAFLLLPLRYRLCYGRLNRNPFSQSCNEISQWLSVFKTSTMLL